MALVVEYLLFILQENDLLLEVHRANLRNLLDGLTIVEAIPARREVLILQALVGDRIICCGVHLVLLEYPFLLGWGILKVIVLYRA